MMMRVVVVSPLWTTIWLLFVTTLLSGLAVTDAFVSLPYPLHHQHVLASSRLAAENGPPQYDKVDAVLRKAEAVGEGSVMLHVDTTTNDAKLDYEPGHVFALEVQPDDTDSLNEYNAKAAKSNKGWMRGPYTVSRATDTSIDILIRLVGDKSNTLAQAQPGRKLKIGGQFHVPIAQGIAEEAKRIVLISTGVGIGPCVGAIEQMLQDDAKFADTPICLLASFRTEPEVVYGDYLDELAANSNDKQFQWTPIITSQTGRLSASKENLARHLFDNDENDSNVCSLSETHYHIIGNGQCVKEFQQGLQQAGVPDELVTVESYFNHRATVDEQAVERIAHVVSANAAKVKQVAAAKA